MKFPADGSERVSAEKIVPVFYSYTGLAANGALALKNELRINEFTILTIIILPRTTFFRQNVLN